MGDIRKAAPASTGLGRLLLVALVAFAGLCAVATSARAGVPPKPAWKLLAVTGPTNLPPRQSEVQRVAVEAEDGTFTLSKTTAEGEGTLGFASGFAETTAGSNQVHVFFVTGGSFEVGQLVRGFENEIPPNTTIVGVSGPPEEPTLELSNNATITEGFAVLEAFSKKVTAVTTSTGTFSPGDGISGESIPPETTITAVEGDTLTLSNFSTANFSTSQPVSLTGSETTAAIPFDAPAQLFQGALQALPAFGPDAVSVSGGPGGTAEHPYFVDFGGPLAEQDVEQLKADSSNLVGEHAAIHVFTTVPGGPGTGELAVFPANIGGEGTAGEVTVEVGPLPSGVVTGGNAAGGGWTCTGAAGQTTVSCHTTNGTPALRLSEAIRVPLQVQGPVAAGATVRVAVSGGGGGSAAYDAPISVSDDVAPPGIQAMWVGAFEADGTRSTQAGGHPFSDLTFFLLNTVRSGSGQIVPAGDPKQIAVDLPPGFLGDPLSTERCPQSLLTECSPASVVGALVPILSNFGTVLQNLPSIYNDVPANGTAAEFMTVVVFPLQPILGSVRSEGDFGISVLAPNVPTVNKVYGSLAAFEGEPAGSPGVAFFRNPTDCAEEAREAPVETMTTWSWQRPAEGDQASEQLHPVTGCDKLKFQPQFSFQPSSTQGSSGAGATAHLHIGQEGLTDPNQLATPDLKRSVVTLPTGLNVNPSQANGLAACSEAQVGYVGQGALPNPTRFNNAPVTCPDASKLGTVEATTPLLEEPLQGTVYLAAQEENPFNSLIGLYLVFESSRFGVTLKLPGKVDIDPNTGQITATFDFVPQQPVEDLTLHFRGGGPRSEFATPEVCGTYSTTGSWTPWSAPESGPPAQTSESFTVSSGCSSSAAARPFHPSFEGGSVNPLAGAYSPLVIKVNRQDGEQELKSLDFTLPPGETGKLAGVPYCPESAIGQASAKTGKAELASPSCPPASQIGTVDAAAGVGGEPVHVEGKVYLAGPYKGAPLSAVVITPAVSGPFDLGDVVIRSPLFLDLETAQITAKSDPIPTILRGIPLKIRSVAISIDRSGFSLNPTNCEAMTISATLGSSDGATAKPSNRFQVGSCNKLKFKPGLKLSLKGATKRSGHPALKAVVTYPKKGAYANIARAQVGLPHSEFLDQGNLDKVCKQAELRSATCPKRSIYGHAKAWTPLLDNPLEGPVYIGVGFGHKLPDLVADLNGQVRILLHGKVDTTKHEGIRNTFEVVPDAPVSRFVLEMKGGKKYGLLENSENLCRKLQRASAHFVAQNGLISQLHPKIANQCGKKHRKGHHRKHHKGKAKHKERGGRR